MANAVLTVSGGVVLNVRELKSKATNAVWAIRSDVAFLGGVVEMALPMDYGSRFPAMKVGEHADITAAASVDNRGSLLFTVTSAKAAK